MTAILVVLLCVAFVLIDLAVREVSKRADAARARKAREAALDNALQMTFSEAKSLKRAEVPGARARILAVDDEPVVLDSLRKILVLAGFSVDTVESGPEALTLVRAHDYDFVFTDLKMPEMDGVEVVKAVNHLRPDVDIAVITGFGTIETAVATMRHGAVDYVQKPFTADEMASFAERLLIRRQARLEAQRRPTVRVVAPALAETVTGKEFCVPGGVFIAPGHTWARIDAGGPVWVGLDDFARKALRSADRVELPETGTQVRQGDLLFVVRRRGEVARFLAPVSGQVARVNPLLSKDPSLLVQSPYDRGWVCLLKPSNLAAELTRLKVGAPVVAWYQEEVARLRKTGGDAEGTGLGWAQLEAQFFELGASEGATAKAG